MMNIAYSFVQFLQDQGFGVFGQNLFIGNAPSSNKVLDSIWWVVAIGGNSSRNITGETTNNYVLSINYRDRDYEHVYNMMQQLNDLFNCLECVELENYTTISVNAEVVMVDDDLDLEDRKIGVLQVNITIYDNCR